MKGIRSLSLFVLLFLTMTAQANPSAPAYRVIVFLSPVCPICQYYALELRELHKEFSGKGFEFQGLVPGKLFTTADDEAFRKKYELSFDIIPDAGGLHYTLGATITPEVFVLGADGHVIYSGRIDDSYAAIGKLRRVKKHHELRDVLTALSEGRAVPTVHEPAVGCLIQK